MDQRWLVNSYPEAAQQEFNQAVDSIAWGKRVRNPAVMSIITVDQVVQQVDAVAAATLK